MVVSLHGVIVFVVMPHEGSDHRKAHFSLLQAPKLTPLGTAITEWTERYGGGRVTFRLGLLVGGRPWETRIGVDRRNCEIRSTGIPGRSPLRCCKGEAGRQNPNYEDETYDSSNTASRNVMFFIRFWKAPNQLRPSIILDSLKLS